MKDDSVDVLMGAGCAVLNISKQLENKHEHGLAFMLSQLGEVVFKLGVKLDEEVWLPQREV